MSGSSPTIRASMLVPSGRTAVEPRGAAHDVIVGQARSRRA